MPLYCPFTKFQVLLRTGPLQVVRTGLTSTIQARAGRSTLGHCLPQFHIGNINHTNITLELPR